MRLQGEQDIIGNHFETVLFGFRFQLGLTVTAQIDEQHIKFFRKWFHLLVPHSRTSSCAVNKHHPFFGIFMN
jgi:hypothetical protein